MDMLTAHSPQVLAIINKLKQVKKTPPHIKILMIFLDHHSRDLMVKFQYSLDAKSFIEKACQFITSPLIHFTPARQLIILGEEFREYTLSNQTDCKRKGAVRTQLKRVFYQSPQK